MRINIYMYMYISVCVCTKRIIVSVCVVRGGEGKTADALDDDDEMPAPKRAKLAKKAASEAKKQARLDFWANYKAKIDHALATGTCI